MMSGRALRSQGNDVSTHQHTRTHTHGFTHSPAPVHSLVSHSLSHTPCLRGDSTLQQIFSSHRWDWSVRALVKLTSKLTRRAQSLRCPHFSTTSSGWAQKSAVSEQQLFQTVRLFFVICHKWMNTPQHSGEKKKTLKTVFIRCQTCLLIGEIYLMCQAGLIKKRERSVRQGGVWWSLCLDRYGIQTEQGHICLLFHTLFLCFFVLPSSQFKTAAVGTGWSMVAVRRN